MNLLQKIITWGILAPCFISCSDRKSENFDDTSMSNSWYEDAETAEKQLLTSETKESSNTVKNRKTIIFDASTTNTALIGNGRGPLGTLTGSPGNLILTKKGQS